MRQLTDYERGFLEAAIDGEGMLTLRKQKNSQYKAGYEFGVIGSVDNTNIEFLRKIQNIVGKGGIVIHQKHRAESNYKTSYRYHFPRESMRWLLPQINFTIKERQKNIVLRALALVKGHKGLGNILGDERTAELEKLVHEIRSLNTRGLNAEWNRREMSKLSGAVGKTIAP